MATIRLLHDFKEFLQLLNENEVEYLLVGAYAVSYYGDPCLDGDLDVWISRSVGNVEKLRNALNDFDISKEHVQAQFFLEGRQSIQIGILPVRIDILTDISGLDFESCYRNRSVDELDGITVSFINLDDLKTNKQASGRAKDIHDLEHLS